MRLPRILCVDDEENNVVLLEAVLEPLGYEVLQASDGRQALEILGKETVDLVLLDVMMPGMDGYQVCKAIKSNPELSAIPVVMITALTAKEDRIRSIEAGAEDFLSKPFDRVEVAARVKMLLKVKELGDRLRQSYSNINQLTDFGKNVVKQFDPMRFDLLSAMDHVVGHVIDRPDREGNRPEKVIVGIALDPVRWEWYVYEHDRDAMQRKVLPFDLRDTVALPQDKTTRILSYQESDMGSGDVEKLLNALSSNIYKPRNMLCYLSDSVCVICCDYGSEITKYDADVLNAIVMQSVFLKTIYLQVDEIAMAFDYSLHALARASEVHDEDTGNHILRVGEYSALLARELKMPDSFLRDIKLHAVTHDVGKMHIPLGILLKPGRLDVDEFAIMKRHTTFGALILGDHIRLGMARNIALHHHENWTGDGYPGGLAGDAIPIEARIVKLADQYDAMRSRRPYKPPFGHRETCRILAEGDDRIKPDCHDPAVLRAFKSAASRFEEVYERLQGDESETTHGESSS